MHGALHPCWTPMPLRRAPHLADEAWRPEGPSQLGWVPALPTNPRLWTEIRVQACLCPTMAGGL